MNLAQQYAKVYKDQYSKDIQQHLEEKALKIWHEHKAEILEKKVHNEGFMENIVSEMKK